MKFIKKFEAILEEYFSEEEVSDIRDMYIDLVDDLNLITVDDENVVKLRSLQLNSEIEKCTSPTYHLNSFVNEYKFIG